MQESHGVKLKQNMFLATWKHICFPECSHIIEQKSSENTNMCMSSLQEAAEQMFFTCSEMMAHVMRIVPEHFCCWQFYWKVKKFSIHNILSFCILPWWQESLL